MNIHGYGWIRVVQCGLCDVVHQGVANLRYGQYCAPCLDKVLGF